MIVIYLNSWVCALTKNAVLSPFCHCVLLLFLLTLRTVILFTFSLLLLFRRCRTILLWWHKLVLLSQLLLRLFLPLPFLSFLSSSSLFRLLTQEILPALNLQINLTFLLRGRERRIWFLALVSDLEGLLSLA